MLHSLASRQTPVVFLKAWQPAASRPQKSMENYAYLRTAASKSLLVGLNLFYTEESLQGFADQTVENYCLMGAWKHSRDARCVVGLDDLENLFQAWWFYDAARDVPNQPVLGFTHSSMISGQVKTESHHCQKSLIAWPKTSLGTQDLTKHNSRSFVFL